ncbi:hypothetical protein DCAR_0624342 [Daucus carota subsp. sativus]|uniref:Protein LNK1-like n=1 Tax=Daucus carota subsp. sativus TaxID=79200 RepID=A0AAF0XBU5_DAUCS|nr:hypothetical protein DCAR_0624342 [Daucus carota subsp. sativus]
MSDVSNYELEDFIWDQFRHIDDHIVPHSRDENARGHASQPKSINKCRIEVSTAAEKSPAKCSSQKKEAINSFTVKPPRLTMSESEMWTYRPDGTSSATGDGDPTKELATIMTTNAKTSSSFFHSNNNASLGDLYSDDPIVSSRSTAVHCSSYTYPLHTSQGENDFSYMDIPEDESSDLLYYNWDDIGFEDVFRNCESLFELQKKSNDDETDWLSASNAIEGSESASRTEFASSGPHANALKGPTEDLEHPKLKIECSSANDTTMTGVPASDKTSPQLSEVEDTALLSSISVANMSNENVEFKDNIVIKNQGRKKREGSKNDRHVEDGDTLRYPSDLGIEGRYLSSEDTSHNGHTTICVKQHKENLGPGTSHHLLANISCIQSDCHRPSDQTTISPSLSETRLENNTATSLPPKGSSLSFEGLQDKDSSQDLSSMIIDVAPDGRDNPSLNQGLPASFNSNAENIDVASICNPFPVQASIELEKHNDIEGASNGFPAKVGPWYVQDSPTVDAGFNEASLEATSFRQLQLVMEQLDLRTKLCIRDSLYRLARSAEQRHHNNGGLGGDRDARTFMDDGTTKSSGYIDIEADTNPIDRSVAHLLFHRPSLSLPSESIKTCSAIDRKVAKF